MECAICFGELENKEAYLMDCVSRFEHGVWYHQHCALQWIIDNPSCPVCRSKVSEFLIPPPPPAPFPLLDPDDNTLEIYWKALLDKQKELEMEITTCRIAYSELKKYENIKDQLRVADREITALKSGYDKQFEQIQKLLEENEKLRKGVSRSYIGEVVHTYRPQPNGFRRGQTRL